MTEHPEADTPMPGSVKNVIVMVADGAGFNTLEATRLYLQNLPSGDPRGGVGSLVVDQPDFVSVAQSTYPLDTRTGPVPGPQGLVQNTDAVYDPAANYNLIPRDGTNSAGFEIGFEGYDWNRRNAPDSANTMVGLVTGEKTYNNAVNVDGNGNPLYTLAELAHDLGKSAGVVSTVQFSDATPAVTGGAHNETRANRTEIAQEMFKAGILDVIAGTGNPDYDDNGNPRATPDYSWVSEDIWTALKNGTLKADDGTNWDLLQTREAIQAAATGTPNEDRLAMIAEAFSGTNFYRSGADPANEVPFTVDMLETSPTLTELAAAALNKLNTDDDGLYLSIEGGGVDRAMHANNFGRMIEEYIEFNNSVKYVVDWINSAESKASFEDTLLIVTADHDHLLFGPDGETVPYQAVQADANGDGVPEYQWFGNGHSNQLVPLYAYGAGAEALGDLADDIDQFVDSNGNLVGSGRHYTDQAEVGRFLLEQVRLGATDVPGRRVNGTDAGERLAGGRGDDTVRGLGGDDQLIGRSGNDRLDGGSADDRLVGNEGRDKLLGRDGADTLLGGAGHDSVLGGAGNDRLYGEDGNDRLYAEAGNDTLFGGAGRDVLVGGSGSDVLIFSAGEGSQTIAGADRIINFQHGADRIGLTGGLTFADLEIDQDTDFGSGSGDDAIVSIAATGQTLFVAYNASLGASDFLAI